MFQAGKFVQLYLQLDSITQVIRRTVFARKFLCRGCYYYNLTCSHWDTFHHQSLRSMKGLLLEIENHLPEYLQSPFDPKVEIWKSYQTLTCTTVLDKGRFLVIVSIPLLDYMNIFDIFNIFNMLVPVKDPVVLTDKLPSMVAWYRLKTSSITVNLAQMKYVLLTATEQGHCTSPLWHYCDVRSPV